MSIKDPRDLQDKIPHQVSQSETRDLNYYLRIMGLTQGTFLNIVVLATEY